MLTDFLTDYWWVIILVIFILMIVYPSKVKKFKNHYKKEKDLDITIVPVLTNLNKVASYLII